MGVVQLMPYPPLAASFAGPIRMVNVTLGPSVGTQDIEIPGFGTPSAAMIIMNYGDAPNEQDTTAYAFTSIGMTDGVSQACAVMEMSGEGTAIGSNAASAAHNNRLGCLFHTGNGTLWAHITFNQWLANGIRINREVANPLFDHNFLMTVILFHGSLDTKLVMPDLSTTPVTVAVGFEAQMVLSLRAPLQFNSNVIQAPGSPSLVFGAATWNGSSVKMADLWHYYGTPGDSGDGRGRITTGTLIGAVTLSNFDADSFDAVAGQSIPGRFAFLAIGGLSPVYS